MNSKREKVAERFAFNLFKARRQAGLSQAELARRTGLHRTEVSFLERAQRIPRLDTMAKLCDSLEIEPAQLFDGIHWLWEDQRFSCQRTKASELIGISPKRKAELDC